MVVRKGRWEKALAGAEARFWGAGGFSGYHFGVAGPPLRAPERRFRVYRGVDQ